ncbi:MAG: response regulator [Croceimicrobium sp.]|nr:response regulator [Bacteroidota bacterium]
MNDAKLKGILLIDDDPISHFLNKKVIEKLDINVHVQTVDSAQAGLEMMKYSQDVFFRPCLILLDLNMPGMTGWDFIEAYKNLGMDFSEQTQIVILSTSENPDDRAKAKEYKEVHHYLSKPLGVDYLQKVIGEIWPATFKEN